MGGFFAQCVAHLQVLKRGIRGAICAQEFSDLSMSVIRAQEEDRGGAICAQEIEEALAIFWRNQHLRSTRDRGCTGSLKEKRGYDLGRKKDARLQESTGMYGQCSHAISMNIVWIHVYLHQIMLLRG